jgi:hypothetical protein
MAFIEPKSSSPHSQKTVIGSYPEPDPCDVSSKVHAPVALNLEEEVS